MLWLLTALRAYPPMPNAGTRQYESKHRPLPPSACRREAESRDAQGLWNGTLHTKIKRCGGSPVSVIAAKCPRGSWYLTRIGRRAIFGRHGKDAAVCPQSRSAKAPGWKSCAPAAGHLRGWVGVYRCFGCLSTGYQAATTIQPRHTPPQAMPHGARMSMGRVGRSSHLTCN
jgi:hypothetical protein